MKKLPLTVAKGSGRPDPKEQAVTILSGLGKEDFVHVIARAFRNRHNDVTFSEIEYTIEQLDRTQEEKHKHQEEIHRQIEKQKSEPNYAFLESFYSSQWHPEELEPFKKMTLKENLRLQAGLNSYKPEKRHHLEIKEKAIKWLQVQETKIQAQAQNEPQQSKSLKIARIGKFLKRK